MNVSTVGKIDKKIKNTLENLEQLHYNMKHIKHRFGSKIISYVSKEENSMVELIVGKKGKGKTKVLLDKVNGAIKEANGSIVYLDKSTKHMYELNNKVRLIDVSCISD